MLKLLFYIVCQFMDPNKSITIRRLEFGKHSLLFYCPPKLTEEFTQVLSHFTKLVLSPSVPVSWASWGCLLRWGGPCYFDPWRDNVHPHPERPEKEESPHRSGTVNQIRSVHHRPSRFWGLVCYRTCYGIARTTSPACSVGWTAQENRWQVVVATRNVLQRHGELGFKI